MKFLVVVAPPSIYHGCSTWKTFWEEKFTGKKQDFFVSVNMRNCGQRNVRKHREIKDSDERFTILDLSMFPNIALTTVSHVHRDKKNLASYL